MNKMLFGTLSALALLSLAACTSSAGDDDGTGGTGNSSAGGSGNEGGSSGGTGNTGGDSGGTGNTGGTSGGICADNDICGGAVPQTDECAECAGEAIADACSAEFTECSNDLGDDVPAGCLGCGEWLTTEGELCTSSEEVLDALQGCICGTDVCG